MSIDDALRYSLQTGSVAVELSLISAMGERTVGLAALKNTSYRCGDYHKGCKASMALKMADPKQASSRIVHTVFDLRVVRWLAQRY